MVKYLYKHGITNEAYKKRTEIMVIHGNVITQNEQLEQTVIDCQSNVGELLLKLIDNSFYSLCYADKCKNECNRAFNYQYQTIFLKENYLRKEIINLDDIEEAFPHKRKCDICQEMKIREFWKISKYTEKCRDKNV